MPEAMLISFHKMHGLGNDFVVLDGRKEQLPVISAKAAAGIADRWTGIGCDQLIVLEACDGTSSKADFRMRIYNSDGGEVEACGNASRAIAILHNAPAMVETAGGVIALSPNNDGTGATVDMGVPKFGWEEIPLDYDMDTASMPVSWGPLKSPIAVNVGNPHAVFFTSEIDDIDLELHGPDIENDLLFPDRVNVNIAHLIADNHIKLRVWERGVGETRACGTGACATAIAAMKRGLVGRRVNVTLPGGTLQIEWDADDHIQMSGPATTSFTGSFEWDDFA